MVSLTFNMKAIGKITATHALQKWGISEKNTLCLTLGGFNFVTENNYWNYLWTGKEEEYYLTSNSLR